MFENGSSESSASAASAGVFVVPIAGPLPRERDGSPWPKTWRELAMSEDRAPERLFELVFKLVCRRVPGGAAPVLPPGYAASLSSVVRTFVNAQVLTHGQGQFAARTAQPRARRRRCQPQPQPAASAVPGRKPKPLQVLVRSQDVDRPGDIKSCIIGEFYMPELRRSKPPLQRRDLRYEAIFEDQAQPAFGPSALRLRLGPWARLSFVFFLAQARVVGLHGAARSHCTDCATLSWRRHRPIRDPQRRGCLQNAVRKLRPGQRRLRPTARCVHFTRALLETPSRGEVRASVSSRSNAAGA